MTKGEFIKKLFFISLLSCCFGLQISQASTEKCKPTFMKKMTSKIALPKDINLKKDIKDIDLKKSIKDLKNTDPKIVTRKAIIAGTGAVSFGAAVLLGASSLEGSLVGLLGLASASWFFIVADDNILGSGSAILMVPSKLTEADKAIVFRDQLIELLKYSHDKGGSTKVIFGGYGDGHSAEVLDAIFGGLIREGQKTGKEYLQKEYLDKHFTIVTEGDWYPPNYEVAAFDYIKKAAGESSSKESSD